MSEEQTTPFKYVAVTLSEADHRVFLVHNSTPEWWRAVAAFKNRKRAEVYAEVENFCVEDRGPGEAAADDESPAPPGLSAEPPSSLTVLLTPTARPQIVAPEPKPETPAPPVPEASGHDPDPVPDPGNDILESAAQEARGYLPPATQEVPEAGLTDAATLPPLTEKQAKIWDAIRTGARTQGDISRASGFQNVNDATSALHQKGYILQGDFGRVAGVLADGPASVGVTLRNARGWTEVELSGLRALCEAGGDFAGFGKSINRTEAACRTQASIRGWYQTWSKAHWAEAVATHPPVAENPPAASPEPAAAVSPDPAQEEPETTDLDDLNYAQKAVLKAIMSLPHDSNDKAVAEWADLDVGRIPGIVKRLVDLGCLGELGGFTTLTELGRTLVGQIKIARAVRILTPVVRRVPEKPPVPEARPARESHNGYANPGTSTPLGSGGRIDAVIYLERKGAAVSRLGNGQFIVNGERRSAADVVHLINSHRRMAELPAIDESQIC